VATACYPEPPEFAIEQELENLLNDCRSALLSYAAGVAHNSDAANDALQEASLRYLVARHSGVTFDNPRAWMFRVARHYLFDQMKKQSRQPSVDAEQLAKVADPNGCPDQAYRQTFLADTIGRALSKRERVCIHHRLDGLSYEDISRSMGISTNTVGVLINRAVKKVRAFA
jgi:RNA polymerase sigma-70 factor, ECF subfamily